MEVRRRYRPGRLLKRLTNRREKRAHLPRQNQLELAVQLRDGQDLGPPRQVEAQFGCFERVRKIAQEPGFLTGAVWLLHISLRADLELRSQPELPLDGDDVALEGESTRPASPGHLFDEQPCE